MQKQFNDSIIYVRNGKPLPAIVLASQATAEGELLTLLYADPVNGPQLLAQGTTRGIAQVQKAVAPFVEGNMFGWKPWGEVAPTEPPTAPEQLDEDQGPVTPGDPESPPTAPEQLDEAQGPVTPGDPESPHAIPGGVESDAPAHEIKTYSDGTVVSGPGPMPELSPAQQDAAELVQIKAAQNQPDA
jgi:hypothetical protein